MIFRLTKDDAFRVLGIIFGNRLGRLGSLLAILGATSITGFGQYVLVALFATVGVSLTIPEIPIGISLLILAIGVGTAVYGAHFQAKKNRTEPTPHDVELFQRYRQLITASDLDFLRTHDFGNSFYRARTDGLDELAKTWTAARNEFNDPDLERLFAIVKARANELNHAISVNTGVHHTNFEMSTALPPNADDWDLPPHVQSAIKQLNVLATQFVTAVDDFERAATPKLSVTTVHANAEDARKGQLK